MRWQQQLNVLCLTQLHHKLSASCSGTKMNNKLNYKPIFYMSFLDFILTVVFKYLLRHHTFSIPGITPLGEVVDCGKFNEGREDKGIADSDEPVHSCGIGHFRKGVPGTDTECGHSQDSGHSCRETHRQGQYDQIYITKIKKWMVANNASWKKECEILKAVWLICLIQFDWCVGSGNTLVCYCSSELESSVTCRGAQYICDSTACMGRGQNIILCKYWASFGILTQLFAHLAVPG